MRLFSRTALVVAVLGIIFGGYSITSAQGNLSKDTVFKGKNNKTLYYYSEDGKRYVFPNEKTYKSWYNDFNNVVEIDDSELGTIPLGGNVRYKPGSFLVKITTDPKVYAVSGNGRLRWVKTEALARALYGDNWNLLIDDVPDAFFVNYVIDEPIDDETEFDPADEEDSIPTIDINRKALKRAIKFVQTRDRNCENLERQYNKLRDRLAEVGVELNDLGDDFINTCVNNTDDEDSDEDDNVVIGDKQVRICHIVDKRPLKLQTLIVSKSAVRGHLRHGDKLGRCHSDDDDDDSDDDDQQDTTAPTISSKSVDTDVTEATITWVTNEEATSAVSYAMTSLNATSTTPTTKTNGTLVKNHSVELTNLTASTTYYFIVHSKDAAGNTATSTEMTFTTDEEIVVDNTAPIISSILATPTSTAATITWTTNEAATSKVTFADVDLGSASTTDMVSESAFVTSHQIELTGLATSTQYFFKVESKDESGNTAESSQESFITS